MIEWLADNGLIDEVITVETERRTFAPVANVVNPDSTTSPNCPGADSVAVLFALAVGEQSTEATVINERLSAEAGTYSSFVHRRQ